MSRFNATVSKPVTKTVNKAGGVGYKSSPELELVSTMLTSFVQDSFYEKGKDTNARISHLLDAVTPKFAAQAAIYARDTFNMRSITHAVAGDLAPKLSGNEWAKDFYTAVVVRPDDMTEIMSYVKAKHGVRYTKAMQKGFAKAFNKFDSYSLSRYRAEGKDISLVDVANMVHPKADNPKTAKALEALIAGTLKQSRTFEAKLSQAGKSENKAEAKAQAWSETVPTMGYMALVKNLRNIMQDAPQVLDAALARLVDPEAIAKSRLLPLRYVTAYTEIAKLGGDSNARKVMRALSQAVDIAMVNVPKFEGRTLIALDSSGSMTGFGWNSRVQERTGLAALPPCEIGGLFAAMLVKSNDADFIMFDGSAKYVNLNTLDSTFSITEEIKRNTRGGATNFSAVFQTANKAYDRIIVISDMQSWEHIDRSNEWKGYNKRHDANPHLYLFNVNDYGTLLFPENRVYAVAGFSEKVFDIMNLLESDRKALVNEVRKVKF